MRRLWSSLRFRLAISGFVAIYVPVLILFGVVTVSEETNVELGDTTTIERPDGTIEVAEEGVDVVTSDVGLSPWVWLTALLLAPVAAISSWWWAGRAVGPIDSIRSVAEEIGGGALDRRIALDRGPSEITGLAASFDAMLDRLETAATTQRQLIDETSHELRTPLAVLTTNADVVLAHPDPSPELYREGILRSRSAAERLRRTIDDLLTDARRRARSLDRQPADLRALVGASIDDAAPMLDAKDLTIAVTGPDALPCRLDPSSLERAMANLIDNAIRHAPPRSTIEIKLSATTDTATVAVIDHGPGIDAEAQRRVFERFWHEGDHGGQGLGLPIARQIAEAHGGRLGVVSPGPAGDGCRFELELAR